MPAISKKTRNVIFCFGLATLAAGAALLHWAWQHWNELPNYQRMAVIIPITSSYPMLMIDAFREWEATPIRAKWNAITALLTPLFLLAACLYWWTSYPTARG